MTCASPTPWPRRKTRERLCRHVGAAVLNLDDRFHDAAAEAWSRLVGGDALLLTSNHIVVETTAVIQHRRGIEAVRVLSERVLPMLTVEWVTPADHAQAMAVVMAAGRRQLSLVDAVSFTLMRRLSFERAFTFDPHFDEQGLQRYGVG